MSVTPGYDWGTHDKPNRQQLLQSALGLQISDIPFGQLDAAVIAITVNDSTAASNLPADGAMWVDLHGNLWGRNRFGNVRVRRYNGGLETNRIASLGNGGGAEGPAGKACRISVLTANATNVTEARLFTDDSDGYALQNLQPAVNQETTVSSATTFFRHVILGHCRLFTPDFGPTFAAERGRLYMRAVNSPNWVMEKHDVGNTPAVNAQAETNTYDPEGTQSYVAGWFFGLPVKKA